MPIVRRSQNLLMLVILMVPFILPLRYHRDRADPTLTHGTIGEESAFMRSGSIWNSNVGGLGANPNNAIPLREIQVLASSGQLALIRSPAIQDEVACGVWRWDGPEEKKDLRIETTLITEASGSDCHGAFRFENNTGVWGFGGYSLELIPFSENSRLEWEPPGDADGKTYLFPPLDIENHVFPIDKSVQATNTIRGEMTFSSFLFDVSLFVLKTGFALMPGFDGCLISEEQFLFVALRTSSIFETAAELAFKGDFIGARDELLQVSDTFFERAGEVFKEFGIECAVDLAQSIVKKPLAAVKIGIAFLSWVPIYTFDFFKYKDQGAIVSLVYTPPPQTAQHTQIILFQPPDEYTERINGSCWTFSIASPREGAWRCMSDSRIFDPCFSPADETSYVICGVLPLEDDRGFRLNLLEPLPAGSIPSQTSSVLALELEDGTTCRFLTTGTLFAVEGRYFNYGCSDGSVLLEVKPGKIWTAVQARLSSTKQTILETVEVRVNTVWI